MQKHQPIEHKTKPHSGQHPNGCFCAKIMRKPTVEKQFNKIISSGQNKITVTEQNEEIQRGNSKIHTYSNIHVLHIQEKCFLPCLHYSPTVKEVNNLYHVDFCDIFRMINSILIYRKAAAK